VQPSDLIQLTDRGLYCAAGDFYLDPWLPVERAVVTHAHSDHARPGSRQYLTTPDGEGVLRLRVGPEASIQAVEYGSLVTLNGVRVSLHPAGHILGSAQVRLESSGEIWAVSGDYEVEPDPTCTPFEPLRCHTFVTEATFGLPIYRWPGEGAVLADVHAWWRSIRKQAAPACSSATPWGRRSASSRVWIQPSGPSTRTAPSRR
jgi:putative mRNA 3-end processing factor